MCRVFARTAAAPYSFSTSPYSLVHPRACVDILVCQTWVGVSHTWRGACVICGLV